MKRVNGTLAFAACLLMALSGSATEPVYINNESVLNPQIDATTVINNGSITVSDLLPFETASTLNVTNYGTMYGVLGFRFEYKPTLVNNRWPLANFANLNQGTIEAPDTILPLSLLDNGSGWTPLDPITGEPTCYVAPVFTSRVLISSTNIVNRSIGANGASLIVGANGGLQLDGQTVDLTRSGLEVLPVWAETVGDSYISYGNDAPRAFFSSDVAIYDITAATTNYSDTFRLGTAGLWDGFTANAPGIPGTPGSPGFQLLLPDADSYITWDPEGVSNIVITNVTGNYTNVSTNDIVITNIAVPASVFKGAVFVGVPAGFGTQLGFYGGSVDFLQNIGVLLTTSLTNVVTGGSDPAYIYFEDELAGETFRGLSQNVIGCPQPSGSRPQNYWMGRLPLGAGASGNNGYPQPDFFTSSGSRTNTDAGWIGTDSITNSAVEQGDASGYQSYLDNIVSRPPAIPAGTITNYPGRVRINATDTLDMSRTRIRAEGEIMVTASHLISATNAVLDCENLSFHLTSTNGNLNFNNLSKDTANRLRGYVTAYSALWSNAVVLIITNNYGLSNVTVTNMEGTNTVESTNVVAYLNPLTNEIGCAYHTLMLDATTLQTVVPVNVYDLVTHSTNVVLNDNATVVENFLIDGESMTIGSNSVIQIAGSYPPDPLTGLIPPATALLNWNRSNAPNLLNFTNHGQFYIPMAGSFGWDGNTPYANFRNTGTISAYNLLIQSDNLENEGILSASATLQMAAGTADLFGGQILSGGSTVLKATDIRLNQCQMLSGDTIELTPTNSLSDAGPGSSNVLNAPYGFKILNKPLTGDLLGTTLQNTAPIFWETEHVWAGEYRTNVIEGYHNNLALGRLMLSVSDNFGGQFLRGAGSQNGLYVDVLDISGLGQNWEEMLRIDSNLVVYFAAAKIGFTPPGNLQAEEYLDGKLGNRLRWARDYAGPNSSVAVVVNGQSVLRNRALRNSKVIDSDGDGIPNYYDGAPFDTVIPLQISLVSQPSPTVEIKWTATAGTVYRVDYSTNITSLDWQPFGWVTNSAATNKPVVLYDTNAPMTGPQRFYRVRVWP